MLTMYSTQWCGYCRRLAAQLDREGIAYRVVDIEQDPAAWEAYHLLIPVVELDGEAIFYGKVSPHRLREILRAKDAGAPALTPRYKAFLRRLRDMMAKR